MERELLVQLCKASPDEQAKVLSSGVDADLFQSADVEAVWVWEYHGKYARFPSVRLLLSQFPRLGPIRPSEPLRVYVDRLHERRVYEGLSKIMQNVGKTLATGGLSSVRDAVREMRESERLLGKGYSADVPWSKWDAAQNYLNREQKGTLYVTPYRSLNRMIRGVRSKNLFSIVARMGLGKTWVACVFTLSFWEQDADVLLVSKEMGAEEIYERMDALYFDLDWDRFLAGRYSAQEMRTVQKRREQMFAHRKNKLVVTDSEDLEDNTIQSVVAKIQEHRPKVVVIDGAYLLEDAGKGSFWEKVRNVSAKTKRLARTHDVVIVQTLQFNRGAVEEGQAGGALENIAFSDAYAMDSDYVLSIKGERDSNVRKHELLKGRTLLCGAGAYYVNSVFSPKLDFQEIGDASKVKCIEVDTVEG